MAKKSTSSRDRRSQQTGSHAGRRPASGSGAAMGAGRLAIVKSSAGGIDLTSHGNTISPQLARQASGEVLWTAAEMQTARPAPMPQLQGNPGMVRSLLHDAAHAQHSASQRETQTEGNSDPGHPPRVRAANGQAALASGGFEYPPPYTRYNVLASSYGEYPYCCIGKLFFKQRGISYVGTAFSIGNNAIISAGHCLHTGDGDPDGWSTDVVFVPAYNNEATQQQQWHVSYVMTRPDWFQSGNLSDDFGGAVLLKKDGRRVSDEVGALGFAWGKPREQHWHAIGYPSQAPFGGAMMVTTQSAYAYDGQVGPVASVAIGCDMTPGCSGGPWILGFGTANEANGLNSYRRADFPEEMCSPYFDERMKTLKDELVDADP